MKVDVCVLIKESDEHMYAPCHYSLDSHHWKSDVLRHSLTHRLRSHMQF